MWQLRVFQTGRFTNFLRKFPENLLLRMTEKERKSSKVLYYVCSAGSARGGNFETF